MVAEILNGSDSNNAQRKIRIILLIVQNKILIYHEDSLLFESIKVDPLCRLFENLDLENSRMLIHLHYFNLDL